MKIKWDQEKFKICFQAVHEAHVPVIMNELNKRGIIVERQVDTKLWWIRNEEALDYEYEYVF